MQIKKAFNNLEEEFNWLGRYSRCYCCNDLYSYQPSEVEKRENVCTYCNVIIDQTLIEFEENEIEVDKETKT